MGCMNAAASHRWSGRSARRPVLRPLHDQCWNATERPQFLRQRLARYGRERQLIPSEQPETSDCRASSSVLELENQRRRDCKKQQEHRACRTGSNYRAPNSRSVPRCILVGCLTIGDAVQCWWCLCDVEVESVKLWCRQPKAHRNASVRYRISLKQQRSCR